MIRRVLCVVMLSLLAMGTTVLGAQPFSVYYDVVGLTTSTIPLSLAAQTTGAGIAAMDLTRGAGINPAALTNGFSADGWEKATSRQAALATGAFFQFGFSVQPGTTASLSALDMSLRRSAANAPMNIEVQASFDNFATPGITIATFTYFGRTSGTRPTPDPLLNDPFYYMSKDLPGHPNTTTSPGDPISTIDLTKYAALQNLPEGSVVSFRLYAWGNTSTTSTNTFALGRMLGPKIQGTVAQK